MIKIEIEKERYGEGYVSEYISKEEFMSVSNNTILNYIKIMSKIKDKNNFILNIYKILFEISIENIDKSNMRMFVNNFYKHIKVYKKHMINLSKECKKNTIHFYLNILENEKINIDTIRYVLHILYNQEILSGKDIIEWYKKEEEVSKYKKILILKDFIEWLEGLEPNINISSFGSSGLKDVNRDDSDSSDSE